MGLKKFPRLLSPKSTGVRSDPDRWSAHTDYGASVQGWSKDSEDFSTCMRMSSLVKIKMRVCFYVAGASTANCCPFLITSAYLTAFQSRRSLILDVQGLQRFTKKLLVSCYWRTLASCMGGTSEHTH